MPRVANDNNNKNITTGLVGLWERGGGAEREREGERESVVRSLARGDIGIGSEGMRVLSNAKIYPH